MEVGEVTHRYRPSVGGIENYVARLNAAVRDRGHEARTFTTDASLEDGAPVEDEPVEYARTLAAPLRNPLSVALHRAVRRSDCDLYHLHSPWFLTSVAGAHAVPEGRPTVMTVHSAEIARTTPLVRALNLGYRPLAGYALRAADHSFVQGETERRRLLDRFDLDPGSVSVVPNGIRPAEFDVSPEEVAEFRREQDLDPATPTVPYVSRLVPEKNPGVLVEAVTEGLPDRDLQVLVVGDGEPTFVRSLRERADGRFRFRSGLAFRALYVGGDGALKVFTLVPGATVRGVAPGESRLRVSTAVSVPGGTFTYRREVETGPEGSFAVTVPYPGEYAVGAERVEVTEAAVREGRTVRAG